MDNFVRSFDARRPWVYAIVSALVASLFALRLPPKDTMFVLMNVVIYIAITSGIFYGYTKYEEKKITEGYIKQILGMLYEDKKAYAAMVQYLKTMKNTQKPLSFVEKYTTYIFGGIFVALSLVYYGIFRNSISLTSIGRNAYNLTILGFTELFITFFVMTRIPHQDVINLMDTFIRSKETCSKKNAVFMSNAMNMNVAVDESCHSFSKDGDTCITHDTTKDEKHYFVCDDGKIKRQRNF